MNTAPDRLSDDRVVIVGAGHAGGRLAHALRARGFAGEIVLMGEEPVRPYERPPLSKAYLSDEQNFDSFALAPGDQYESQRIALRLGQPVVAVDRENREVQLANGERVPYGRLVIATGARPRRLDVPGAGHRAVRVLRTVADADALRPLITSGTRLVLIGAGVIGLEVAATARSLGASVTVIEREERIMSRLVPAEIAARFAALHAEHRVELHCGVTVSGIDETGNGLSVAAGDGAAWPADVVLVGIGVSPATELASACGLAVDDGIAVDEQCRTSDPRIYAIGDVAAYPNPLLGRRVRLETWQNAENHAAIVAASLCGEATAGDPVPWFWTDQYGVNVQFVGLPPDVERVVWRDGAAGANAVAVYLRDRRIVGGMTWNSARDMRFIRRLVAMRACVSPDELADKAVTLAQLVERARSP